MTETKAAELRGDLQQSVSMMCPRATNHGLDRVMDCL